MSSMCRVTSRVLLPLLFGILVNVGCTDRGASPGHETNLEVLMQMDRDFARATAERGVEGWMSWFAEDGAQLVPGREVRGHAQIREYMTPAFADTSFSLVWEPIRADIAASGDLGYTTGRWRSRRRNPENQIVERSGSYTSVWRKEAAGNWKVVLDLGVPDPED